MLLMSLVNLQNLGFRSLIRIATTEEGQADNETKGILKSVVFFVRPSEPNYMVVISKHVCNFFSLSSCRIEQNLRMMC